MKADAETGDDGAEVMAALSDPTRRAILDLISEAGEATATTAARTLPVSRQAVVKHLAVLERAGLVDSRRRGREVRWSVRPERLETTAEWLRTVASEWDARLRAIRLIAEGEEERAGDGEREGEEEAPAAPRRAPFTGPPPGAGSPRSG